MCSSSHPPADCWCRDTSLDVTDPTADLIEARQRDRIDEQRRAAGVPAPTITQMAAGFGKERACIWCYATPVVEGGLCVRCADARFGRDAEHEREYDADRWAS